MTTLLICTVSALIGFGLRMALEKFEAWRQRKAFNDRMRSFIPNWDEETPAPTPAVPLRQDLVDELYSGNAEYLQGRNDLQDQD